MIRFFVAYFVAVSNAICSNIAISSYGRFMSHRISHLSQSATTHSNNHASSNNHISPNDHINSGNHLNHQDADCMDIHHAVDDVKFQSEPSEQITQQAHQPKHNLKSNMSLWTYFIRFGSNIVIDAYQQSYCQSTNETQPCDN